MTVRIFVFCDACNPDGMRAIEGRRAPNRVADGGRRLSDERAWYEGPAEDAIRDHGWLARDAGRHLCPRCAARLRPQ